MELCKHKANPKACPLCYHLNSKQKPKEQPRQFIGQQITQGRVVAQDNPVATKLLERKLAAIDKIAGAPSLAGARASIASTPTAPVQTRPAAPVMSGNVMEDINPHDMPPAAKRASKKRAQEEAPEVDEGVSASEIAALEQLYPKRASIIDRQPTHPEGTNRGSFASGGGRPVVTKGRPVGS